MGEPVLLFWLSLVPLSFAADDSAYSTGATAAYGIVLGAAAIGYFLTERAIVAATASIRSWRGLGMEEGMGNVAIYGVAIP
ncbi:hypothetical protein ACFOKF_18880 [Sphingobium rhizovicinum]|uniref:Uncharacterized protein n=1 Tax=Sphingobium rhizovicinum TaxID=432308 RepID=A0ABV7NK73_9SPHN